MAPCLLPSNERVNDLSIYDSLTYGSWMKSICSTVNNCFTSCHSSGRTYSIWWPLFDTIRSYRSVLLSTCNVGKIFWPRHVHLIFQTIQSFLSWRTEISTSNGHLNSRLVRLYKISHNSLKTLFLYILYITSTILTIGVHLHFVSAWDLHRCFWISSTVCLTTILFSTRCLHYSRARQPYHPLYLMSFLVL